MSGKAAEIMALRERIDGLADLPFPELRRLWAEVWDSPPPRGLRRRLLMLGIAWRWQAGLMGGFPAKTARRLVSLEAAMRKNNDLSPADVEQSALPAPGTRLVRIWQGTRHEVHVTDTGYIWRGKNFASLSAIAKVVTGSNRNGPAFFGLRKPKEAA